MLLLLHVQKWHHAYFCDDFAFPRAPQDIGGGRKVSDKVSAENNSGGMCRV